VALPVDSDGPFLGAGLLRVGSRLLPAPRAGAPLPRPLGAAPQPASGSHRPAPTASRPATPTRVGAAHAPRAAGGAGTSRSKPPAIPGSGIYHPQFSAQLQSAYWCLLLSLSICPSQSHF